MNDVNLSRSGPPERVLDPEPAPAQAALAADDTVAAIGDVCTRRPTFLDAWSRLGDEADAPTRG